MSVFRKKIVPIAGFLVILPLSAAYFSMNQSISSSVEKNSLIHVQSFQNFKTNTEIEVIYKNKNSSGITSKFVTIQNKEENTLTTQKDFSDIVYHIKKNDKYIDIQLTKNKILVSGLQQGQKIQLNREKIQITKATPVDWAGRLTLRHSIKDLSKDNFCITLLTENENKICHQTKQQVAS